MKDQVNIGDVADAEIRRARKGIDGVRVTGRFDIEIVRNGEVIRQLTAFNRVVTTGLNDILDKYFSGSGYTAALYVGLIDDSPTIIAGDTMASHAGWAEVTAYDESNRQALTMGSASSGSINNSASKASFTISTNATDIGGLFVATDNTKGGTSGTLISAVALTGGDEQLDDDDVVNATYTLTLSVS